MEAILARKGIKFLSTFDEDNTQISYAFNADMLRHNIFILMTAGELDDEDDPEYETALFVHLIDNDRTYDFTIAVDNRPVVPTLYIYRLIVDLVDIISNCQSPTLIKDLQAASTGSSDSKEPTSKQGQQAAYEYTLRYWDLLQELIKENRAESN